MHIASRTAVSLSAFALLAPLIASAGPQSLASGMFESGVHPTSGTATVYKLDDGSHIVRLTNFHTSNGPKVHVLLADHEVSGNDVVNSRSIDLGDLKGNAGNQNYTIPAGTDLATIKSVSIWCARFKVNFGAASIK